jgi:hypothetical protein
MLIPRFFSAIDGRAQLGAADGQFLGLLSSKRDDPNSISNFSAIYGSYSGTNSMRNRTGLYGSEFGMYSPYNIFCLNPPVAFFKNKLILVVSRNPCIETNGLPVIDPDFLLGVYAQLGYLPRANACVTRS